MLLRHVLSNISLTLLVTSGLAISAACAAQDLQAVRPTQLICTMSQIKAGVPPFPGMGIPKNLPAQTIVTTREGNSNWHDSKAAVQYAITVTKNEVNHRCAARRTNMRFNSVGLN